MQLKLIKRIRTNKLKDGKLWPYIMDSIGLRDFKIKNN